MLGLRVVVMLQTKMYTFQEFYQKFLAVSITFLGSQLRQKVCLVKHGSNGSLIYLLEVLLSFTDLIARDLWDLKHLALVFAHA